MIPTQLQEAVLHSAIGNALEGHSGYIDVEVLRAAHESLPRMGTVCLKATLKLVRERRGTDVTGRWVGLIDAMVRELERRP